MTLAEAVPAVVVLLTTIVALLRALLRERAALNACIDGVELYVEKTPAGAAKARVKNAITNAARGDITSAKGRKVAAHLARRVQARTARPRITLDDAS